MLSPGIGAAAVMVSLLTSKPFTVASRMVLATFLVFNHVHRLLRHVAIARDEMESNEDAAEPLLVPELVVAKSTRGPRGSGTSSKRGACSGRLMPCGGIARKPIRSRHAPLARRDEVASVSRSSMSITVAAHVRCTRLRAALRPPLQR